MGGRAGLEEVKSGQSLRQRNLQRVWDKRVKSWIFQIKGEQCMNKDLTDTRQSGEASAAPSRWQAVIEFTRLC